MLDITIRKVITKFSASLLLVTAIAALQGCGDSTLTTTTATATTTQTVAGLQLSAAPTTIKSDGSAPTTITITAVDSGNAVVPGTLVNISADTGALGAGTVTTGTNGAATVSFNSGTANKINRTATVTATAGSITAQIPVQIVGSTVTVTPSAATLPDNGTNPVTLTITAKDAGGIVIPNTAVTITKSGTGNVTLNPMSGTTDGNGQLGVTATGAAGGSGTVTVSVAAVGATATSTLTVSPSAATFGIDQQTLNGVVITNNSITALSLGVPNSLIVRVNAPAPTTSVVFASSIGLWNGTASVVTVPVAAGKASATLTTTGAGVANVQVYDAAAPSTSDSLTVTMTAAASAANSITIQASPALVPKSTGASIGYSTLTASVKDVNGYPVGGAPVSFEILNPTGGGETVSPTVVFSATTTTGGLALGDAPTTFASGSLSSGATGVQIRASVVGTAIKTEAMGVNVTSSGNDASVVIGGTAGSVAFGQATVLKENTNGTAYILPMSVLVADANGNPAPLGTAVNLSVWPIAWSTGSGCMVDADTATTGTFLSEDSNENVSLDSGEDGARINSLGTQIGGTVDSLITPPNSAGGTLPGTVYTDASGVATFDLTYTKTSAIWIVDRIRARTTVQGSEAVGEVSFQLAALKKDADPVCYLPPSPFNF